MSTVTAGHLGWFTKNNLQKLRRSEICVMMSNKERKHAGVFPFNVSLSFVPEILGASYCVCVKCDNGPLIPLHLFCSKFIYYAFCWIWVGFGEFDGWNI